ncbi:expressed protein [Phakopsora pachyrhizi]|uniref:Expressed protein n=1 Tax=Phakopsora pachyrhizi TaxID=170000 RepID=A0AAV0B4K7_PHAPC|nr:expressed protein [Phakopsora pachyrhizi]
MQLYEALLSLLWCTSAFQTTVFGFLTSSFPKLSSKDYIESARETLALHDSISDPRVKAFGDLFSISKVDATESKELYSQNASENKCRAISRNLAPRMISKNEFLISGSRGTASIAKQALGIVQNYLRRIQKPNNQLLYFPEDFKSSNTFGMDEAFLESMKAQFIDDFCNIFKILYKIKEPKENNYEIYGIKYNEAEEEYYTWAELSLRALNCLLLASPKINGEGKKIVQEILKDDEVLEIIKHQFSITVTKDDFNKELHIDFEHYLKQNSWSQGIAEVFDELSKKDQFDIFNYSIKLFIDSYEYKKLFSEIPYFADNYPQLKEVIEFFDKTEAVSQLATEINETTVSVSGILINFIANPTLIDENGNNKTLWLFTYYIVEHLVRNQCSNYFQTYKDQIIRTRLLEKIDFMKSHISLKNNISRLLPKSPYIKQRQEKEILEMLADDRTLKWFKNYLEELENLCKDVEKHVKEINRHEKNQANFSSLVLNYENNFEELISALIGFWINSNTIVYFWEITQKKVSLKIVDEQRQKHLLILQKAVLFKNGI